MKLLSNAGLSFGFVYFPVQPPQHSVTFVVKTTCDLIHNGTAEPLPNDDQPPPEGDVFYDGDPTLPCRSESDYAIFKPEADLLIAGKAYTPGGKPAPVVKAGFAVGDLSKSLICFGQRYWSDDTQSGTGATEPRPFTSLALRYENAYGGPGYADNPIGKGHRPLRLENGEVVHPLPNIELPGDLVSDHLTPPDGPYGFGPIGRHWPRRQALAGSYGGDWLKKNWPYLPPDFDWHYFNAAPPDQRVAGYLRGDEPLLIENMHAEHAVYRSRLPGLRPRLLLAERYESRLVLREVTLRLDTLFIDMETEKISLTWRGVAAVKTRDFTEVEWAYIVRENLAEEPESLAHYTEQFAKERHALLYPPELVETAPPEPQPEPSLETTKSPETAEEPDPAIRENLDQALEVLKQSGADPALIEELEQIDDPIRFGTVIQEKLGLTVTPEQAAALEEKQKADMRKLLEDHGFDPSLVESAFAETAVEKLEDEFPPASQVQDSRSEVIQRRAKDEAFDGEDFSGTNLSHLDLSKGRFKESILHEADLSGSSLKGADLSGAILTRARLGKATLAGANLTGADLSGADLSKADLTGAILEKAIFSGATLDGACLDGVAARGAGFEKANLDDSSARNANFDEAEFSSASFNRANWEGASLAKARIEGAVGEGATLVGAILDGLKGGEGVELRHANLSRARGKKVLLGKARLRGANLSFATLPQADFADASLRQANLKATELSEATFQKSRLTGADLSQANLFMASFERADLRRTDLRHANLYGAEFLDATLAGAQFDGANLIMTKLANAKQDQEA